MVIIKELKVSDKIILKVLKYLWMEQNVLLTLINISEIVILLKFRKRVEMLHLNSSQINVFMTLSCFKWFLNVWSIGLVCSRRFKFTKVGNLYDYEYICFIFRSVSDI